MSNHPLMPRFHNVLRGSVTKIGTQNAAADYLSISRSLLSQWLNLKNAPPAAADNRPGRKFNQPFFDEMVDKLMVLTGQTMDELWPRDLRQAIEVNQILAQREQVAAVDRPQVQEDLGIHEAARLGQSELSPVDAAHIGELREAITTALRRLSFREREIIKLRFGIGHSTAYTLQECARIFKTTRGRIRYLEARAIRRLRLSRFTVFGELDA